MDGTVSTLEGKKAPTFSLQSSQGHLDLKDYLGRKPVVLIFVPDLAHPECGEYIQAFQQNGDHYRAFGASVIVVTAGVATGPKELPFAVASDALEVFRHYDLARQGGLPLCAVVIVDRYGDVASAHAVETCSELPEEPRVGRLLVGAESLCPECGVPEQHWLEAAE